MLRCMAKRLKVLSTTARCGVAAGYRRRRSQSGLRNLQSFSKRNAASSSGHFLWVTFDAKLIPWDFDSGLAPSALRAGFAVRTRRTRAWASKRKVTRRPAGRRNVRCVPQGLPSVVGGTLMEASDRKRKALDSRVRGNDGEGRPRREASRTGCAPTMKGVRQTHPHPSSTLSGNRDQTPKQKPRGLLRGVSGVSVRRRDYSAAAAFFAALAAETAATSSLMRAALPSRLRR